MWKAQLSRWATTEFSASVNEAVINGLVMLSAIALASVLCLNRFSRRRQTRLWLRSGWGVGIVCLPLLGLLILSPPGTAALQKGLTVFLPADSGEPVQAIVVLGRGRALEQPRVELAYQLWQQQRAPQIFISGRGDAPFIAKALLQQGVPIQAIAGEGCSATTEENAWFTRALLPQSVRQILLVTDAPHLWRSQLIYESLGFSVIPRSAPLPTSWEPLSRLRILMREYLALGVYAAKGRLSDRTTVPLPAKVQRRLETDACQELQPSWLS